PDYAATLRRIAADGSGAFHQGATADAIVAAVAGSGIAPGDVTHADLASYAVTLRPPLCTPYRTYRVCGMGPPSSGGLVVAQTLLMLDRFDLGRAPSDALNLQAMHLVAEAEKLAYADRDRYVADPDFVPVPVGLTDRGYLDSRGATITPGRVMPPPAAGEPPRLGRQSRDQFGIDATRESVGTTHLSVIDGEGNAVAMTSTIEAAFGSRLWAAGFLLNNELTDFSLVPADAAGRPIANRVEGGKRPRSSMAPTIVFDTEGRVFAVLGSPGGARIPLYVVKTLVALIDWRLDAQTAATLQNFGSRGSTFEIEAGWRTLWDGLRLSALGHRVVPDLMTSGTHIVVRRGAQLEGGADPRREGIALGD
ncbi:MAG: gamma-glutamyltransferase, partial [Hyphomicrobium sp.]